MSEKRIIIKLKNPKEENKFQKINLKEESSQKKSNLKNSKLHFNKNLLIQMLKKATLRKIAERKRKSKNNSSKVDNFNYDDKNSKVKAKNIYNGIQNNPEMKKFHNITAEKICDLIYSKKENKSTNTKYLKFNKLKLNLNTEENNSKSVNKKNKFVKLWNTNTNTQYLSNNENDKENNKFPKYINNIKYINLSDLNISKKNILPYLSTRLNDYQHKNKKYNSISKLRKNTKTNSVPKNTKKIFNNKAMTTYTTNKWLESIRDSIKKYDILHRRSRIDRLLFFLENPDGCFEENLLEDKPGDKYVMLKNQMIRYKDKFENIIRDIKMNQKKSEYLMKKYIFDLLSRKKDIN